MGCDRPRSVKRTISDDTTDRDDAGLGCPAVASIPLHRATVHRSPDQLGVVCRGYPPVVS